MTRQNWTNSGVRACKRHCSRSSPNLALPSRGRKRKKNRHQLEAIVERLSLRPAEALAPIGTKIFPARVALNSKTDSEGPYYLDVRSDSQALDEGIIAVIH